MREKLRGRRREKLFGIVQTHEKTDLIEAETAAELKVKVDEVLVKPIESYPFFDFKAGVRVIKGREIKLPL